MAVSRKEFGDPLPGAFELFKPSWEAFKLNWVVLIFAPLVVAVVPLLVVAIAQILVHLSLNSSTGGLSSGVVTVLNIISVIVGIVAVIIGLPLGSSTTYWTRLKSAKGVKVKFGEAIKKSIYYIWRVLGMALIRWPLIILGLCLLIIPGLLLWRMWFLAPYYMVDEDLSVIDSLKKSAKETKKYSYSLWPMLGIYVLIQILAEVPVVGWIASLVGTFGYNCAAAVRYLQIRG